MKNTKRKKTLTLVKICQQNTDNKKRERRKQKNKINLAYNYAF